MFVAMSPPTHSDIALDVIKSVVHLTEQSDELTPVRSLQASILEMLPGALASLICLVPAPERAGWILDDACALPNPMFPIVDWLVTGAGSLSGEEPHRPVT